MMDLFDHYYNIRGLICKGYNFQNLYEDYLLNKDRDFDIDYV